MLSFGKEERTLTTAEKIDHAIQKEFGAFDEIYYYNDSLVVMYSYRPEANKTRKIKSFIDKTLNLAGKEMVPDLLRPKYEYQWDTPTETIRLEGVYKETNTRVNVWVSIN